MPFIENLEIFWSIFGSNFPQLYYSAKTVTKLHNVTKSNDFM